MLVNEPTSDDPKFFKGKALTYYGRWTYKYEEAARKGAVGVILIHRTDMASYPWEVVRNSNSGEKSFLKLHGTPQLKVAAWVQLDVAKKLVAMDGMDLDHMIADAQSRDFIPCLCCEPESSYGKPLRRFRIEQCAGNPSRCRSHTQSEAVMYTAHYDHWEFVLTCKGTTSTTARTTTRPAAASCWNWREYSPRRRKAATFRALRIGHGGRTGIAGIGISGQASADSRRKNNSRSEL